MCWDRVVDVEDDAPRLQELGRAAETSEPVRLRTGVPQPAAISLATAGDAEFTVPA